ncbi:MAG: cysteine--tRNA ligase, partial [Candidatus Sumerlaeia bacterium]|nr:cysteine--tRNA ligase [Candidatus Sumerlaeia bacterium]
KLRLAFESAMDDDFNTAEALAVLFNIVSELNALRERINQNVKNSLEVSQSDISYLSALKDLLRELMGVLGFQVPEKLSPSLELSSQLIQILIELRHEARKQKLFQFADLIRSRLAELNIILEDHPQGTIWKFKK